MKKANYKAVLQHSLALLLILLLGDDLISQIDVPKDVLASEGNSVSVGSFSLDYTLGEPFIAEAAAGTWQISEGFHMPFNNVLAVIDSVWPGDANYDGVVDVFDLLPIGIAYGSTGPARTNPTITWTPQAATNWSGQFISGLNFKHADGDGDGAIAAGDTLPVNLNYGFSHNKTTEDILSGTDLLLDIEEDSLQAGDTMHINILLGTSDEPVDSLYGIAFSLNFDTTLVDPASLRVTIDTSWVGTQGNDMLAMWRAYGGGEVLDIGLTRIDQTDQTGYGRIVSMSIIMIDDLGGKNEVNEKFKLTVSRLSAQSFSQETLTLGVSNDSTVVTTDPQTKITDVAPEINWQVYPNPTGGQLRVNMEKAIWGEWVLSDVLGNQVFVEEGHRKELTWDLSFLPEGVYFIQMTGSFGTANKKIWIKR
ncbi:MAG: T9SS type A sorting domain-containing protein [Bacteroidia bacterium]